MSKPFIFYIHGMTCGGCSGIVEAAIREQYPTQLELFNADVTSPLNPKKTIAIIADTEHKEYQVAWEELKTLIEERGYNCEAFEYVPVEEKEDENKADEQEQSIKPVLADPERSTWQKWLIFAQKFISSHWVLGSLGCISGIALLITMLAAGGLPLAAMIPLAIGSTLLTIGLGVKSYYEAWNKLIYAHSLTMDSLFAISTIAVLVVSIASFFVPWLPMMFDVGLLIYGFRHIGIAIEDSIKEKLQTAKFKDRAPKIVTLLLQGNLIRTPLYQIRSGDAIMINPGEIIAVDGVCLEESFIYDTIISGAILPRLFRPGDKVLAGMRLAENAHSITIKVNKTFKESYLARLDAGIEDSLTKKTPLEMQTQQIIAYFIPTVLVLAATSGVIIGLFFPPALAIQCALSVLVSACPCTLGLIIPLAVKTGIHKAAEHGVQFKKAKIQDPEHIDTVVFDLNGTLTMGIPTVKFCSPLADSGLSPDQLLNLCYSLEKKSLHPIGKAICTYARERGGKKQEVSHLDESHHAGITGTIHDASYTIGSMTLMQSKGISTLVLEDFFDLEAGDSVIYIARDKTLIGYIIITDPLRKDARQTIRNLMAMGKDIHLCTGADETTAARYANALGIANIHAASIATSLEEGDKSKPAYIKWLKEKGNKVAMVGDAANDAQALAASDFGIAVLSHDSDELTQQYAGAIIKSDTLLPIISVFAISQQTVSNIKQNLFLSFSYNFISVLLAGGLLLAVGVIFPPALGVVFMAIQACSIFYNVYLFKHQPLEHLKPESAPQQDSLTLESSIQTINKHMPVNSVTPEQQSDHKPFSQPVKQQLCSGKDYSAIEPIELQTESLDEQRLSLP